MMDVSLEFFIKIKPAVKIAYKELHGEGKRNSTLECLFNILYCN